MGELESLRQRIDTLEEKVDALLEVVNHLVEVIYEPEFVKKIDKLVKNGKTDKQ